eukprot:Pgem_evm1s9992
MFDWVRVFNQAIKDRILKYNRKKATRTISNAISNSYIEYENMDLPYNYWTYYYEKLPNFENDYK